MSDPVDAAITRGDVYLRLVAPLWMRTYDQHQIEAREVCCLLCRQTYFKTAPAGKCIACR